ncbi:hypothetical protein [Campylobacter sp. 7477a]|uniref:hypothetical protein n=1 Tax=Campylobacter sp. 7477a TaxID=2735741 RepID=UPI00301545EE
MQTLSRMRRNSTNSQFITKISSVAFLFLYEIATTQFGFLPPLLGLFFTFLILEYNKKQKSYENFDISWYFCLALLLFTEQIHGFYLFSSIVAFLLFFHFVVDWLILTLKLRNLLLVVFVASGYATTFLINNIIAYTQNAQFLNFDIECLFYIIIESALAVVFLKERAL